MATETQGRRGLGQHLQQVRRRQPVRRLQGIRLRPRRRPPGAGGLPRCRCLALRVKKTYKLYMGGKFPRSESGRSYPVSSPDGTELANAALASRKDARDAVAAARKAQRPWAGQTAYLRGQILYRAAEMLGRPRRAVRRRARRRHGRARSMRPLGPWRPRRTGSCTTRAGPTSTRRRSAGPTRSPARTSTTPRPSRSASSARSAPQDDPFLGLDRGRRPGDHRDRQHRGGPRQRDEAACPR